MTFSERHGYTEVRTIAQIESMDDPLRTELWNATWGLLFEEWQVDRYSSRGGLEVGQAVWTQLLGGMVDQAPLTYVECAAQVKRMFRTAEWFVVYSLIELILREVKPDVRRGLTELYEAALEKHLAGYRIVGRRVTPITDSVEAAEVSTALEVPARFAAARHHLDTALTLFSDRDEPDYANSIKESISAVEAMVLELTGKAGFHGAIDTLPRSHGVHGKLVLGWKNLYGFTSDADGVRHAGSKPPEVTQTVARYFLVTCSAFVNLLVATEG